MNKIKKYLAPILIFLAVSVFAGNAIAQKVGFVNVSIVMKGAPQAIVAKSRLESEFSDKDQELQEMEDKIRSLREKLKKNTRSMKETGRSKLRKQIVKAQREFKTRRDEIRESFNIRQREELAGLQNLIYEIVIKLSKERKLDLVVSEPVLYANDKINLTQEVLDTLKKQAK